MLSEQLAQSQTSLQTTQRENANLRQQLNDARQQITQLTTDTEQQSNDIKRLSAQVESADKDELVTWFTRGGIVAGAGILLGVLLTYMPKKRNRSKEWM
jgi:SH3 domain protein